jgi:hypothetical protein
MPSGWTLETLKEHYDALREGDQRAIQTALDAFEKRMDSVNEFRKTLSDQQGTFARKEAVDIEINNIKTRLDQSQGRGAGIKDLAGWIVSGVVAIVAVAAYLSK